MAMTNRNKPRSFRNTLTLAAVFALLVISGCGGDGTASTDPTGTTSAAEPTNAPVDSAGGPVPCHDLFSDEDIAELFSEPSVLDTEDSMDSIGQKVCSWTTIDDADDDLASQVLTIQVYSGDPVPGENFYDPSIYGDAEVRQIEGIGDEAYITGETGFATAFLDGDIAGFVDYSPIVFGETDQVEPTEDQVIDILRRLHDRVT